MSSSSAVVLVGPMGVGKTTVGKKLAKTLGLPFVDTDALIVKRYGDITNIFDTLGEAQFRVFEEEAVLETLASRSVVATGGGAVLSERTREALAVATVVYLSTDGRHISGRIKNGKRPLLKSGVGDWRSIYESRRALYEQVADITVDTSDASLANTIAFITRELEKFD